MQTARFVNAGLVPLFFGLLLIAGCARNEQAPPPAEPTQPAAPATAGATDEPAVDAAPQPEIAPPPQAAPTELGDDAAVAQAASPTPTTTPAAPPTDEPMTLPDAEIDPLREEQQKANAARTAELDTKIQAALDDGTVRIVESHWPDGTLRERKSVRTAADGSEVEYGHYARWHVNGVQEVEVRIINGKKEGRQRFWHDNGKLWTEQWYVDGRRHGLSFAWDPKGRKTKQESHDHGKPHGVWKVWNKRGLKWQQAFEHGVPVSDG